MLTAREVAEELRARTDTVYRLCKRGELPRLRVSTALRIQQPADLEAFLARGR